MLVRFLIWSGIFIHLVSAVGLMITKESYSITTQVMNDFIIAGLLLVASNTLIRHWEGSKNGDE